MEPLLLIFHLSFLFICPHALKKNVQSGLGIFISSRTELKLGSWALNYSFPTDKPRPCSGIHAAAGHMVLYKNAGFVAQRRHSSHGGYKTGEFWSTTPVPKLQTNHGACPERHKESNSTEKETDGEMVMQSCICELVPAGGSF